MRPCCLSQNLFGSVGPVEGCQRSTCVAVVPDKQTAECRPLNIQHGLAAQIVPLVVPRQTTRDRKPHAATNQRRRTHRARP